MANKQKAAKENLIIRGAMKVWIASINRHGQLTCTFPAQTIIHKHVELKTGHSCASLWQTVSLDNRTTYGNWLLTTKAKSVKTCTEEAIWSFPKNQLWYLQKSKTNPIKNNLWELILDEQTKIIQNLYRRNYLSPKKQWWYLMKSKSTQ